MSNWPTILNLPDRILRWANAALDRPTASVVVKTGMLVAGLIGLQSALRHVPQLPPELYQQSTLTTGLILVTLRSWLTLSVLAGLLVTAPTRLCGGWGSFEDLSQFRRVVVVVIALVTWVVGGYDLNGYFMQPHWVDRLVLAGLALLAVWRPIALLPFLWVAYALLWQFDEPLHFHFSWTEINLPLQLLSLVAVAVSWQAVVRRSFGRELLIVTISLIAASYWASGWGKLQLDWLSLPSIYWLLPAGYAHGWLSNLDPATIAGWTEQLRPLTLPLMAFTLLIECGALLVLSHRRVTLALLAGWVGLHVGILIVCGIAFWKWIVIEAALGWWWWRHPDQTRSVYTPAGMLISVALVLTGSFWMRAVRLAWYDTPLTYTYQLQAVSPSDERTLLSSSRYALYSDMLAFSNFAYLDPGRRLNDQVWGSSFNRDVALALASAKTLGDVQAIEAKYGEVASDEGRARQFDNLIRCFTTQPRTGIVGGVSVQAPGNLWVGGRGVLEINTSDVSAVDVHRLTWLYTRSGPTVIRDDLVRTIVIGSEPPDCPASPG